MSNLIELSGQYYSGGQQVSFEVVIQMPEQDSPSGDYFCKVLSQQLFSRRMDVYGVSRSQAIRLAITLVKESLTSRVVAEDDVADGLGELPGQGGENGR